MKFKIINVVGARPNFMKIAPLTANMSNHPQLEAILLHTGQHYEESMSKFFFDDLAMPEPDVYLRVGSANHGEQMGKIMIAFEKVVLNEKPNLVVVVGDVNSTIACAMVAVKQGVRVAHVEAGLRSFDRTMPEEINRLLTDQISDFLFVTEKSGEENLLKEGIDNKKIHFVGNVMIDTLLKHLERARVSNILDKLHLQPGEYAALTLHRPSNVDTPEKFLEILKALSEIQKHIVVVFPLHPRTRGRLRQFGFEKKIQELSRLVVINPLGYSGFLKLMSEAKFVLTDSGGIQEETTVLGVPCLTLRENTERPVTVTEGTNRLVGSNAERIFEESMKILAGDVKNSRRPELWDGQAAKRIIEVLLREL